MKLISHRGNIIGKNEQRENTPDYIQEAINLGYDVEVDLWLINDKWYLGHDKPETEVNYDFLINEKLWLHCKNLAAFSDLYNDLNVNCFWHEVDKVILTSDHTLWMTVGQPIIPGAVCVLPELASYSEDELKSCFGICSDVISVYKEKFNE